MSANIGKLISCCYCINEIRGKILTHGNDHKDIGGGQFSEVMADRFLLIQYNELDNDKCVEVPADETADEMAGPHYSEGKTW